ncbi:MAG TPA: FecR domain-containing protein [Vicinamibacteria bacterium]|jgi:hypothetical protein|nr:FecR domain-containing protein [Vicinamibacteria bacterium]
MAPDKGKPSRPKDDLIDWFTVSYRSIYIAASVVVVIAGGGYFYYASQNPHAPPASVPPVSTSARFTNIDGSVQVRVAGTLQWVSADRNIVLNKADLVRTGSGASAEIRFFDGTVFHVRADSLLAIEETSEDPASKRRVVAARISSGEVNFQTVPRNVPGSAAVFSTPTVRTTAGDDSAGNILVQDSGDSGIKIFKGTARAESRTGEKIELAANTGVRVDAAGKLGPKITLPGIPILLAPPHQAEISYPNPPSATTLLAWKAVAGAVSYHVLVDYAPAFSRPVVDRKNWQSGSMELRGLDVGTYYWKVAAVDKEGVEGSFSEFARFAVTRPRGILTGGPPPALIIDPLEPRGNILQVKGKTEPGASLTVNGQRVDVQTDGSFNEFITLEGGKQLVVFRATGINGGVNEQKRPLVVPF